MSAEKFSERNLQEITEQFDRDEVTEDPLFIIEGDPPFVEEDGDISDAPSEHSDHLTESELEADSSDDENVRSIEEKSNDCLYGRNGYKWYKKPAASSCTKKVNVAYGPGAKGAAANLTSPLHAWSFLFTDDILENIVRYTNRKINEISFRYGRTATFVHDIDVTELRALLGLLILSGVFKSRHEDVTNLFATDSTGRDIFRATMSKRRFLFLLSVLCFDDQETRLPRKEAGDKLALISEIFEKFNENCENNYTCGEYAVVDEMLVGFRGRCSFRQFLKSKPQKHGLKIMCMCDAQTHYMFSSFIYSGRNNQCNSSNLSVPTMSVLRLAKPIMNSNRNITGNSWFSSIQLVDELSKNGLTYMGTMKKDKIEIPKEFLSDKGQPVESSLFCFTKDKTLVSYVPKKSRRVIVISSMHHDNCISGCHRKPDIIEFYNYTKNGVEALNQKCAMYSCHRHTRRWPLAIFSAMLDISRVNAFILFKMTHINTKMSHRQFMISLGKSLISDHLKRRPNIQGLSRDLQFIIRNTLGQKEDIQELQAPAGPVRKYQRCPFCPRNKDRKVKTFCMSCKRAVCKDHSQAAVKCIACQRSLTHRNGIPSSKKCKPFTCHGLPMFSMFSMAQAAPTAFWPQ